MAKETAITNDIVIAVKVTPGTTVMTANLAIRTAIIRDVPVEKAIMTKTPFAPDVAVATVTTTGHIIVAGRM